MDQTCRRLTLSAVLPILAGMKPLNVLIIPDKFKGTLTGLAAATAMAAGWALIRPKDRISIVPMCDGGDGFGPIIGRLTGGRQQQTTTVDAAGRAVFARWWFSSRTKIAVVEAAQVNGLALMSAGQYHPFELDTFGLGKVLMAAAKKGAKHCLIGVGGSATNDGGFGLARACGWKFFRAGGDEISRWTDLKQLHRVDLPPATTPVLRMKITVAVDVQNPLLGARGCSRIYGPQKGLRSEDMMEAEANLGQLARVLARATGFDAAKVPGAGAAGGLGFGLLGFFRAEAEPGFKIFAQAAKLRERLRGVDLVITGEGSLDAQTLMGKGVGEIALLCRTLELPCIGLAGHVPDSKKAKRLFHDVRALTEVTSLEEAKARPAKWLKQIAAMAATDWSQVTDQPGKNPTLRRHQRAR